MTKKETLSSIQKVNHFVDENKKLIDPSYRHHYHLMAPVGWLNDPNGFVYFRGEYHLFYQYYPYDSVWGPMHWGHATSKDLIHWEHLPVALAPTEPYDKDGCFSGSAIEKDGKLYLMYTGHVEENGKVYQTQCIASSEDGVHFEKHINNPVIGKIEVGEHAELQDFRDPKVFEREDGYYAVIASKTEDNRGKILLFKSDDLLEWSFYSVLLEGTKDQGIMWECPDLFHLDGKDVLIMSPIQMTPDKLEYPNTSSTAAFIGEVDWEKGTMTVENIHEIDFGLDFYAPQTTIDGNNRRIMVAWMQMWGRDMPTHDLNHHWAGAMTLPRELKVKDNVLIQRPVSNIYSSLEYYTGIENVVIENRTVNYRNVFFDNSYMHMVLDVSQTDEMTIRLAKNSKSSLALMYDKETEILSFDRKNFGYNIKGSESEQLTSRQTHVPMINGQLVLEIFRDTSSIEIFANGLKTMTFTFYEIEKGKDISFEAKGLLQIGSLEMGSVKI
ncbi:glycoside hydrolase family 32 protein [Jeotgalibaca sp. MA1X17-3]|uniref:glycoside hydrolase family 32 protein n=1 Tax=Jeotgalibaca sp. MA1X17-3 TaxID=2908211 RepID=UPI001F2D3AFC|nr:glycoside hydrolase family 32 protein [Jeotgalibaca sp. MA1X17-3]UJF16106.1 glycoside hydrolase family 32 protein [Jeotgalibaca sp. MA1X17-3]